MARNDREKRSLLSFFLRRKGRRKRSDSQRSVVNTESSKEKSKSLKQQYRSLRKWLKASASSTLEADKKKKSDDISLNTIIRAVSRSSAALVDEKLDATTSQSIGGKNQSQTQRIKQALITNFRRLALATPAIGLGLVSLQIALNLAPARVVRQIGYTNRFDRALQDQQLVEAALLVKNQISSQKKPSDQDLFRYALILANDQQIQKTRELFEFLTDGVDRSFGLAHLELARAYSALPKQSDQTAAKIEGHLIRAMVDSDTETIARLSLGRLYRLRGRFNDAERMLDPIRTNEEACIELGLVRNAQGRFDDVPTTLAPYITRWRDQWKNPENATQFVRSAIGLILLKDESTVIAALDTPKIPIPQTQVDELRRLGLGLLLDRLLREGTSQYQTVYDIIDTQYKKLTCSPIWIRPLMELTSSKSPIRLKSMKLRDSMTATADCDPAFLHEFAVLGRERGELDFARDVYEKILKKYPDEALSLNNLAIMLLEAEPKDPRRALTLIEPLVTKYPDFLEIFDTRGQIKLVMGKSKESIDDFLKALPVYCMKPDYHTRLAQAYRSIKDETNARIHEEVAKELAGIP